MPSPYSFAPTAAPPYALTFQSLVEGLGFAPTKAVYAFTFPSTGAAFVAGGGTGFTIEPAAAPAHVFTFQTVTLEGALLSTRNIYVPLLHKSRGGGTGVGGIF